MDHLSKKGIAVLGTMIQNRINKLSLPSKKETNDMKRGDIKQHYLGDDQTIVVWKTWDQSTLHQIWWKNVRGG